VPGVFDARSGLPAALIAGEAWDVALQIAALREQAGPSALVRRSSYLVAREKFTVVSGQFPELTTGN